MWAYVTCVATRLRGPSDRFQDVISQLENECCLSYTISNPLHLAPSQSPAGNGHGDQILASHFLAAFLPEPPLGHCPLPLRSSCCVGISPRGIPDYFEPRVREGRVFGRWWARLGAGGLALPCGSSAGSGRAPASGCDIQPPS